MALQVWLPFTDGTLKQQGLNSASATVGGTVNLTNAGKLGKCATIGTAAGGITLPASTMNSFTECSVAFWIKIISWNTSYATFFQAGLGSTPWPHYIFGILRNNQNSNLCFTLTNSNGSSSQASYVTSNLNTGQWYHLVFTYKAGTICTYIDGLLDKTYSTTYVPNFAGITHISIGRSTNNSNYQTNCSLNDFRIYDHALSQMEVKELSKGLVLHYPLNRGGWGQENFILESHKVISGGNASGITRTYESDGSMKIVSTSGNGNWCSLGFAKDSNTSVGNNMAVGDTYCISCDVKIETGTVLPTLFINSGNGYKQLRPVNGSIIIGKWMRVYYTSTWANPGTSYGNIQLHLGFSGVVGTYYFKNFKLEKGSIPTPWCPNTADALATTMGLNGTTEYDCSGYCNNGTRTGTFSWTSDTPKYQVSTVFTNNRIMNESTFLLSQQNHVALAAWVKLTSYTSDRSMIALINQFYLTVDSSGRLSGYAYGKNPEGYHNSNSIIPLNQWTHVAIVWDDSTIKFYINGQLDKSITSTGTSTSNTNYHIRIGQEGGNRQVKGNLSDVRVYATALSASDVKSLYQNCATIDPDGTIRGQIRS